MRVETKSSRKSKLSYRLNSSNYFTKLSLSLPEKQIDLLITTYSRKGIGRCTALLIIKLFVYYSISYSVVIVYSEIEEQQHQKHTQYLTKPLVMGLCKSIQSF